MSHIIVFASSDEVDNGDEIINGYMSKWGVSKSLSADEMAEWLQSKGCDILSYETDMNDHGGYPVEFDTRSVVAAAGDDIRHTSHEGEKYLGFFISVPELKPKQRMTARRKGEACIDELIQEYGSTIAHDIVHIMKLRQVEDGTYEVYANHDDLDGELVLFNHKSRNSDQTVWSCNA